MGKPNLARRATLLLFSFGALGLAAGCSASRHQDAAKPLGPCPWNDRAYAATRTPEQLARKVSWQMRTDELARQVVVTGWPNQIAAVPRLCIPRLQMTDGPGGINAGQPGLRDPLAIATTAMPNQIATAATFDPSLAAAYGKVLGRDATSAASAYVQAPMLNLLRIPNWGRVSETFGEDPYLISRLGLAMAEGIRSTGSASLLKHYGPYSQGVNRYTLNTEVSARALEESYLKPFFAVAQAGQADAAMCSYGRTNATPSCADPGSLKLLRQQGFKGFVRTDMDTGYPTGQMLASGTDLVKRASADQVLQAVASGELTVRQLHDAVTRIFTPMFARGLNHQALKRSKPSDQQAAAAGAMALHIERRGAVLLRNEAGMLPIASRSSQLVVAGVEALRPTCEALAADLATAGHRSACITPDLLTTKTITVLPASPESLTTTTTTTTTTRPPRPTTTTAPAGGGAASTTSSAPKPVKPKPVKPKAPKRSYLHTRLELAQPTSTARTAFTPAWGGSFLLSLSTADDTRTGATLSIDGEQVIAIPAGNELGVTQWATVEIPAGRKVRLVTTWDAGHDVKLTMAPLRAALQGLRHEARSFDGVVVLGRSRAREGMDRPSLRLDGASDSYISAAAKERPTTVVLLGGGAVSMPWLEQTKAVLELWTSPLQRKLRGLKGAINPGSVGYSGPNPFQAQAASDLLTGAVNPAGHLPITFPYSLAQSPAGSVTSWPGVGDSVNLAGPGDGALVGYRWYDATGTPRAFPFGFGLSYTSFTTTRVELVPLAKGVRIWATVANTGPRMGIKLLQVYGGWPARADEPARALVGFQKVRLEPGQSKRVSIFVPSTTLSTPLVQVGEGRESDTFTFWLAEHADDPGVAMPARLPVSWTAP